MPKAIKPIIIFIGDEQCYNVVSKDMAESYCGVKLEKAMPTEAIFKALQDKMSVYFIQKSYGAGSSTSNNYSEDDRGTHKHWANLVGDDHIAVLPSSAPSNAAPSSWRSSSKKSVNDRGTVRRRVPVSQRASSLFFLHRDGRGRSRDILFGRLCCPH